MLLLAAILTIVGIGDILRVLLRATASILPRLTALASVMTVVLLGTWMMVGPPWWLTALCALPAALWFVSVPVTEEGPSRSMRVAGPRILGFLLLTAVLTVLGEELIAAQSIEGFPATWPFGAEFALLATGLGLFHVVSANAVVRLALCEENRGAADRAADHANEALVLKRPQLKGGRWIGPLERIALTGLLVAGAYPVAAGLMAAKGIVRFPEIQQDRTKGNMAEYFLVGSFVSWTIAILAAGLLWIAL